MWERFSYYGMRALLILYMIAPVTAGGLGFATAMPASIYGIYTGSVWGCGHPRRHRSPTGCSGSTARADRRHHDRARPFHAGLQALPFFYAASR